MFDHYTKFTKLYAINRATTNKILDIVISRYIPEVGKPQSVITDHGTQFRGRRWRETLTHQGVKTYKTSVYHPNSNPADRVLREVGRILRTYCHSQQRRWEEYLSPVSYTHLDVYKRQINKSIINDRTSPGEIDEILKKFYCTRYISIWDCLLYTSRCV